MSTYLLEFAFGYLHIDLLYIQGYDLCHTIIKHMQLLATPSQYLLHVSWWYIYGQCSYPPDR